MRTIIIAAGEGTRWGDHLGVPKHLAPVPRSDWTPARGGYETLLARTVAQFVMHGDVYVVAPDDVRYQQAMGAAPVPRATPNVARHVVPVLRPELGDADKFLSSCHLWNPAGRTVVAYGDVWFSDAAIEATVGAPPGWWLVSRFGPSALTGTPWGECFAQVFDPDDHAAHFAALMRVARMHQAGTIPRCGGWEHYRAVVGARSPEGFEPANHDMYRDAGHRIEVDDLTDDFDFPDDYTRWLASWRGER